MSDGDDGERMRREGREMTSDNYCGIIPSITSNHHPDHSDDPYNPSHPDVPHDPDD